MSRTNTIALACLVAVLGLCGPSRADDTGITEARLIELADGGYAIEADVSTALVPALRTPVLPERFAPRGRPRYRQLGVGLVVRFEFDGAERPLAADDVVLLPWARSAVLLTARWRDGEVTKAMFGASAAGIRIPIDVLRPRELSPSACARAYMSAGYAGLPAVLRLLLVLGLVLAGGSRALRLALVLAGGYGVAMVALDLGAPSLPPALGSAGLALGAALLARSALRDGAEDRLVPFLMALGVMDGLGLAGGLARSGLAGADLVPAYFGAAAAVSLGLVVCTALLDAVRRTLPLAFGRGIGVATGGLAVAVGLTVFIAEVRQETTATGSQDVARFAVQTANTSGGGGSRRASSAARRLDDPALLFVTIEPREVRLEILLRLADFVGPLAIDGGARSVVPVEAQARIAARALRLVDGAANVVIDGRTAVALLERTEFVTVSATGVATRTEPQPEPLATAVLGVTRVFGVERPPASIELTWSAFPTAEAMIPAVWTSPIDAQRVELTETAPRLSWSGDLAGHEVAPARVVPVRPPEWPLPSLVLLVLAGAGWIGFLRRRPAGAAVCWAVVAAALVLYPFQRHPVSLPGFGAPARTETAEIVDALLTSVYRSFDLYDEEAIYDRLALAVAGAALTDVYLENRRALELENRGGARARVDEVEVLEVRSVEGDGLGGFRVRATWSVSGSVSHFGHVHYRRNRYDAVLALFAEDGAWKLRGIEVLDERRVL